MVTFQEANATRLNFEASLKDYSQRLKALGAGTGQMGLTPDAIKFSPEYVETKRYVDMFFANVRSINKFIVKNFKRENEEYHRAARLAR